MTTWESQDRKRRLRAYPGPGGRIILLDDTNREPSWHDGYNDARGGRSYDCMLLGGVDLEAEEYRAGYLQGCAELARSEAR